MELGNLGFVRLEWNFIVIAYVLVIITKYSNIKCPKQSIKNDIYLGNSLMDQEIISDTKLLWNIFNGVLKPNLRNLRVKNVLLMLKF